MLQWMGGSRRKVNTSKKSVQKRQKQYFEQRKQQQQQYQQAARVEQVPEEERGFQEKNNNNRSLDVLSLLNLSTVNRERKSCFSSEGERVHRANQFTQSSPAIQTNEVDHVASQPIEARMSPCHVAATTRRTKEFINARCCEDKFPMEYPETVHNLKKNTEHQLSVIDLVSDGPSSKSDDVSGREAHVAFSIKGLGKVVSETPVHSLEAHVRTVSHGYTSPSKTKRHSQVIKKNSSSGLSTVDHEQDSMWDINLPFQADVMEQPFCPKNPVEYLSNRNPIFSKTKKLRQPDSNDFNLMDTLEDNDLFYHGPARSNNYLPNNLDEEEFSLSPETWADQKNSSDDYLNIRYPAKQDFANEGYYQYNSRRDFNATGRSKIIDIPDLYCQPFSSKSSNFNTADEIWTSDFDGISGISHVKNNTTWPYFDDEDGVESMLSLSEESCSGVTVRNSKIRPPFKSLEKKRYNFNGAERGWKSSSSKEQYCSNNKSPYNQGRIYGSRMFSREAKSPSSAEIEVPNNKRLLREDHNDLEIPDFNTFHHRPDTELMSTAGHLWPEDTFSMSPDLQSDIGFRSTSRKSFASTYAPCSQFPIEDYNFCQSDMKSHDNILPDTASGNSKPKSCEDLKKCQRELPDGLDCVGSAESSDTNGAATTRSLLSGKGKYDIWSSKLDIPQDSMKGQRERNPLHDVGYMRSEMNSIQDQGKNTGSSPITNEKFDRQDISGSNSFEVGNSSNPFEGRSSKYKSSESRSPEKDCLKEVEIELDAEDKLSAAEISDISDDTESIPYKTICKQDSETPVPCQDKREEPEDSGVEERKVATTTGIHPTCQEVLLIEGCVLQLLRVRVVKSVSPNIYQKKLSLLQGSTNS